MLMKSAQKPKFKKWGQTKLQRSDERLAYAFMFPSIFYLLVWVIFPIIAAFVLSFTNYDILKHNISDLANSGIEFVGLKNYRLTFNNPIFRQGLGNTFYYAFFSVILTNALGLCLAMVAHSARYKSFFRVAYYIPCITSAATLVIIFDALFRPGTPLTNFLSLFGVPQVQWRITEGYTMPLAILMSVWSGAGYSMLIYLAGLQEIPKSVYEAAMLDSAPRFKQFRYITLPLLNNKTFFLVATGFIGSLQVYDTVQMMADYGDYVITGGVGGSLWTVVYYIYYVGWTQNKMGRASAVSFILFVIIMIFTFVQRKLFKDQTY